MLKINPRKPLLIANGELSKVTLAKIEALGFKNIVCTDGAANKCISYNIMPKVIIGDLDSISRNTIKKYQDKITFIEKPCQYSTDLEKALDYFIEKKEKEIYLAGIKGGRLDHAFSNLSILTKYSDKLVLDLLDKDGVAKILNSKVASEIKFTCPVNTVISLLPMPEAKSISTEGLYYPLTKEDLSWGYREGQSNFASSDKVRIKFSSGVLMVYMLA